MKFTRKWQSASIDAEPGGIPIYTKKKVPSIHSIKYGFFFLVSYLSLLVSSLFVTLLYFGRGNFSIPSYPRFSQGRNYTSYLDLDFINSSSPL
jgi:hypothetical protein